MRKVLPLLFTLFLCGFVSAQTVYYVDALNGNDSNAGTNPAAPKKTLMGTSGIMSSGKFASHAGDTLKMAGTFRPLIDVTSTGSVDQAWKINVGAGYSVDSLTIKQWEGKQQAAVRLDIPVSMTVASGGWAFVANGVFEYTVPVGTCTFWTNTNQFTLNEGIVDVLVDWDTLIDQYGRHYGHWTKVDSNATVASTNFSWFFTPTAAGASTGGGGKLRVNFGDTAITTTTLLETWGTYHTFAIVPGNVCPLEVGTPTYTNTYGVDNYPTWGAYTGTKVTNFMLDGIHFYFGDPGYRKNKPTSSGVGEDNSAFGVGLATGTVSTGYVRVADSNGGTIQNCVFWDCGYHGPTWAGDHCVNNTYRNNVVWGLGTNTNAGSTAYVFYSGAVGSEPNDILGCRLYDCVANLYTWLGPTGVPITYYTNGANPDGSDTGHAEAANGYAPTADGFISHTNGGSATDNVIRDIEVRRLKVVMFSDTFTTSVGTEAHHGQGFVGGNRCVPPGDNTNPWSYPIRFVDCELVNGIVNRTSLYDNSAYIRCRFDMSRAGDYGPFVGGTGFYSGSIMGAASGASIVGYFGCEVVVDLGSTLDTFSGGTPYDQSRILFQMDTESPTPNSIVAINSSFYNNCAQTDKARNNQWFFYFTNDTTNQTSGVSNRFYGRGNIFAHKLVNSSTDIGYVYGVSTTVANPTVTTSTAHGLSNNFSITVFGSTTTPTLDGSRTVTVTGANTFTLPVNVTGGGTYNYSFQYPVRGLVRNDVNFSDLNGGTAGTPSADPAAVFNVRDCMYANISTDSYIQFGGGTNNGPEASYTTNIDPNGVYLGQDPTIANIVNGQGPRMPFADPSGRSLILTKRAQLSVKYITPNCGFGFNTSPLDGSHLKYSGLYGAWQDGPSEASYRRIMQRHH